MIINWDSHREQMALIIQFYFPETKLTNYVGSCHLRPFKCSTSSKCLSGQTKVLSCKNECLSRQGKHHISYTFHSVSRLVGCCIFPCCWSIPIWITFSSKDSLTKILLSIFPHRLYSHICALCGFTENSAIPFCLGGEHKPTVTGSPDNLAAQIPPVSYA